MVSDMRAADTTNSRTITERADKIVGSLGIQDAAKATRVRDLIVAQYHKLRDVRAALDAKIAQAPTSPGDAVVADAWRNVARKDADLKLLPLHRQFVARLEAELTPEQVNQVKDAMTDGVVPRTFKRYCESLPKLTADERTEILANLLEAREYAMDVDTPDKMAAWFAKCRARINKYLSAAGYDVKPVEKVLAAPDSSDTSP